LKNKIILISSLLFACSTTATPEKNTIRKPDIVSQRANWKDYYSWDGKKWVWSEYLPKKKIKKKWIEENIEDTKGEVTLGKPYIKGRKE
jgi:hypothetical protein